MSTKKLQIITPIVTSVNGETGDITMHSVEYTPQTLTDAQKAQARHNIDASANDNIGGFNDLLEKAPGAFGVWTGVQVGSAPSDMMAPALFIVGSGERGIYPITIYDANGVVWTGVNMQGTLSEFDKVSNAFKITGDYDNGLVTLDKTYAEIVSAINNGENAYIEIMSQRLQFVQNISTKYYFINLFGGIEGNTPNMGCIIIDNDNSVTLSDANLATKQYVDDNKTTVPTNVSAFTNDVNYATTTEVNKKLSLSGGTMTGDIDMGQNSLNNVGEIRMPKGEGGAYITPAGTPTAPSLEIMGLNGDEPVEITGVANPTSNGSAANKSYVDTGLEGKANSSHNHSASNITSGTLPITRGGTNASTAAAARTNLGFSYGTSVPTSAPDTGNGAVFFCQDSGTPLSIANGGTGGATQDAARTNLGLPTQDNRIVTICNGTRLVSGSNITITLDPTEAKKYRAILILLGTPLGGNYGNMYDSFTFPLNPDTWSFRFFNYTQEGQDWQCAKANLSSDWTTFTITAVSGSTNHPCWCYLM